jgi:oxygen-independent coproporphyrinogen-3 oxidase
LQDQPEKSEIDGNRPLASEVTAELMRRYDRQGPRYTSYPTAVEFAEGIDSGAYEALLTAADERFEDPLSLYVHLPFCEARCLFCACHVIITPHYEKTLPYLELLRREIDLVAERLPRRRQIAQLHLGGGTPTYHRPEELGALLDHLLGRFEPVAGAELAIEVDPRVTSLDHIDMLAERGFNRISMGVQDFTEAVQEGIHRIQSVEQTRGLLEHARERGFRGTNVDLIYGLPHQSLASFADTVDTVIDMEVDRLAIYSFAFVPWIRGHQTNISEEDLPDRDLKLELFAMARQRLLEAGYEPIGMDHFAKPTDELFRARREHRLRRNFQGYSVIPASDVVGLGISAIGDVQGAYVQNEKKLTGYEASVTAGRLPVQRGVVRNADDEVRREVIHELMCNFRVDFAAIEAKHDVVFTTYFAEDLAELRAHEADNMVRIGDDAIEATPVGELFVRNLAMCFDRYGRERRHDENPVFSRTV